LRARPYQNVESVSIYPVVAGFGLRATRGRE
jgi:hypothetical protein